MPCKTQESLFLFKKHNCVVSIDGFTPFLTQLLSCESTNSKHRDPVELSPLSLEIEINLPFLLGEGFPAFYCTAVSGNPCAALGTVTSTQDFNLLHEILYHEAREPQAPLCLCPSSLDSSLQRRNSEGGNENPTSASLLFKSLALLPGDVYMNFLRKRWELNPALPHPGKIHLLT